MKDVFLVVSILAFVFTPLVVTVAVLFCIFWKRIKASRAALPGMDVPGVLLASVANWMPEDRREWGAAMGAELDQIHRRAARWWFAMSCLRVALFPPRRSGLSLRALASQYSACGVLAVALPPLGWPFFLFAAMILGIIGGSPYTQSSRWSNPDAAIAVFNIVKILTHALFLAGLPLGLAGLLRRERLRWLSVMGIISSLCLIGWFLLGKSLSGND